MGASESPPPQGDADGIPPEAVFKWIAAMMDPVEAETLAGNRSFRMVIEAAYGRGWNAYAEYYGKLRREGGWST